MQRKLQRYLLQLGLLSLVMAGIAWWIEAQQMNWLTEKWPALLVVSMLINGGCYVLALGVLKRFHDNPQAATFGLLAAVSAHLLFYLFFLIAYVLIVGQMDQIFGLNLFAIYTCFLVFELVSLLNILRPLSKEPKKPF
ncbi:MAG: hypothetical protein C0424_09075 [Sphingobacteriaceae bacterium]|nr:hypothetical protein [Sphingobacteriaceae bacterium]